VPRRDGKHEVGLVFDHPDHPLAFEIGASPDHGRAGMRALMDRHPRFKGRCFLITPQATVGQPDSMAAGVGTLPLDLFLQVVGAQAQAALAVNLGTIRPT